MSNVERAVKGPYYFGEQPSAVDFFLLQALTTLHSPHWLHRLRTRQ